MSIPRNSDVSKHLARIPKRPGIVLPFPTSAALNQDDQMSEALVTTESQLLVGDVQSIKGKEDPRSRPEAS
ncbi:hypothetical protein [Terriglobus sp. TAA 43]|uniref:hypothetical protein n=1 Tax=Terriglobus sp. TAA 43 TaxID=278961 RepID=UPI0006479FE7|nr:hypothetical protein [Terriglobus sp. TAA 43]